MKMLSVVFVAALWFLNVVALAADFPRVDGFVSLKTGRQVYVKTEIGERSQPTIVLVNGLTYNLDAWDAFAKALAKYKFNVVRFDMVGQGKVLSKTGPVREPISYESQVDDVQAMLEVLKLTRVTTVGLSYGGAIAVAHASKYPAHVEKVIAMAPYTEALRAQDLMIQQQVLATRFMFPFNPASDDELYDFFLYQIVNATYPFAEPSILNQPNKLDATFRMVQGIRKLKLGHLVSNLVVPTHLVQAENDQYIEDAALEEFWQSIPPSQAVSRSVIADSEHKIPEARPVVAAAWLKEIIAENPFINNGKSFFVDEKTMTATDSQNQTVIKLR